MTVDRRLEAVLDWIGEVNGEPVTTLARLSIVLGDLPVWPVWGDEDTDLEIFVDDLLAYLTRNWEELLLQQVYPRGLAPERPSLLYAAAERAASFGSRGSQKGDLMASVLDFANVHDLARCFGGLYGLPAFWMMRQGNDVLIETAGRIERVALADWLGFAGKLGDEIAKRLLTNDAQKWQSLTAAWQARDRADPVRIAALSTGQSIEIAGKLIEENLVPATTSVSEAANDNDSLRIAARMVGTIPYAAIQAVLSAAKAIPYTPSDTLDRLREQLAKAMQDLPEGTYPYAQGVHAAKWMRQAFGLDPHSRSNPISVLEDLGIAYWDKAIGAATLDALAIWGDAHGPAVIFNTSSRKLTAPFGKITWRARKICAGHELCHLVLDYRRTLAAIDILDSRMPLAAEQRANAFAAEFALPAQTAADLWRQSDAKETREGVSTILNRLSTRFAVSRMVAGWQLDHGLAGTSPEVVFILDELLDRA